MLFSSFNWAATSLAVLSSLSPVTSSPAITSLETRKTPSLPLKVNTVWEFAFPSWCENLAIRANGQILVSRLDTPELYQVDPTGKIAPILIATWDASYYMGALGISETTPDVFAINIAAPVDANFVKTSGVPAIYKVDMNTFKATSAGVIEKNATVSLIANLPIADFINGMTTLDEEHVLSADVYLGRVYKVDVKTGAYSIAINDPKMKFPANAPTNLGVNGLKIKDSYLYWTNTAVGSLNKIQITSAGTPVGTSSVVTANVPRADDFIFKSDGTAFIAQNQEDELSVLLPGTSKAEVVAGSNTSTILAGVTAGKFGRLASDCERLYLTTSGGLAAPINGTVVVAGMVAYIDTAGF
ncbi:hypothetical protein D0Z07_1949 [Hyphodiscus hymeniophilus]|uniref:Quino amine dehydrogenase beta chain protein n=1 Tax=Hyphodiscus hymeniophilus TaxID=353542 RepID=A0A9P6VPE2_9HELO|nr:hypothetical protein D0Z07_1949 [Hyphodiscus hymeniophilus]